MADSVDRPRFISRRALLRGSTVGVAGLLLSDLLAACGKDTADGGAAGTYRGNFSVPLYKQLPDNIPFIIGLDQGFYAEFDLDLEPVDFTQGPDVIRSVIQQTHLGNSSTISGIGAIENGFPDLRIVGTCLAAPTIVFLVKPDSPIQSVSDLRGKKIGVNAPTSITTYLSTKMLDAEGISTDEAELINVKGVADSATALDNGVVDCSWSSPPLSVQLIRQGKARLLYDAGANLTDFTQTNLFSDMPFLEQHGDVVQRWLQATAKGMQFARERSEEAGRIWAKAIDIDEAIAIDTVKVLAPRFKVRIEKQGIEANISAATELGLIKSALTYEQVTYDKYSQGLS